MHFFDLELILHHTRLRLVDLLVLDLLVWADSNTLQKSPKLRRFKSDRGRIVLQAIGH